MPDAIVVRPLDRADLEGWRPLWDGYNAFYGRKDETALPLEVTETTWQRIFDPNEPVFALVAEDRGKLVVTGVVDSEELRQTVLELTSDMAGGKPVDDNIDVASGPPAEMG